MLEWMRQSEVRTRRNLAPGRNCRTEDGATGYVKEVDDDEKTTTFYQEIYDDAGNLVEIHEKYPVDSGHQKVRKE